MGYGRRLTEEEKTTNIGVYLVTVHNLLNMGRRPGNLQDLSKAMCAGTNLPTVMREMGILREDKKKKKGQPDLIWSGPEPSLELAAKLNVEMNRYQEKHSSKKKIKELRLQRKKEPADEVYSIIQANLKPVLERLQKLEETKNSNSPMDPDKA